MNNYISNIEHGISDISDEYERACGRLKQYYIKVSLNRNSEGKCYKLFVDQVILKNELGKDLPIRDKDIRGINFAESLCFHFDLDDDFCQLQDGATFKITLHLEGNMPSETFGYVLSKGKWVGIKDIAMANLIADKYAAWEAECNTRFAQLKANEEEVNRIFIDIYGLQDELTPEVDDKDVTVRKADLQREIKSLISYAVGCLFGRYSVNAEGLQFAGGNWQEWCAAHGAQLTAHGYTVSKDNIIPICDDDYFEDDLLGCFVRWVKLTYGEETLDENLRFIANALDGKGSPREVIRNYLLNGFYADHLKIYQKRPIYWLFSSGKKNGFKALIYMHRYQSDLLARMRTDYVHEQQERYRTQLQMLEDSAQTASPSERVKLNKRIAKLKDQALEIQKYEEKIHHLADQMIAIDLDDGVKVNYAKFEDVLEKIK